MGDDRTRPVFHATALATIALCAFAVVTSRAPAKVDSPGPAPVVLRHPGSQNFPADTLTQMRARSRSSVAIGKRGSVPFASGVLIARHIVLTCNHCTRYDRGRRSYDPGQLEVILDYEGPGVESTRHVVTDFVHRGSTRDYALLRIAPNQDGALPEPDRVAPIATERVRLNDPVYVVHHSGGGPRMIADGATVQFPFEATQSELGHVIARLKRELADPTAVLEQLEASYRRMPDGTYRNFSRRWAKQPTIGIDSLTSHGSSGAPVFDKRTHALIGIVFAGTPTHRRRIRSTWHDHEAVLPVDDRLVSLIRLDQGSANSKSHLRSASDIDKLVLVERGRSASPMPDLAGVLCAPEAVADQISESQTGKNSPTGEDANVPRGKRRESQR